jgi:hypothetical protein
MNTPKMWDQMKTCHQSERAPSAMVGGSHIGQCIILTCGNQMETHIVPFRQSQQKQHKKKQQFVQMPVILLWQWKADLLIKPVI